MKQKSSITPFLAFFLLPFSIMADTLSLDAYVKLVLKNNPQPKIAAAAVEVSSADREKARSSLLPHVGADAGLSRGSRQSTGASPSSQSNAVSTGIDGQLLLFDFGKTPLQLKAAGRQLEATKSDQEGTIQQTIASARTAYFNHLLSSQLVLVNEDALKQAQEHYEQAKALYDVGKQAKIAVIKADVDVANAQVNLIHARNSQDLSRLQMETTAGTRIRDPVVLTDSLGVFEDSVNVNDALSQAERTRPDLTSAKARVEAARLQLKSARAAYLPSLNASAGYSWQANDPAAIPVPDWGNPGWNIGTALSIPLYEGGSTRASVRKADATLQQAAATLDVTTQNMIQEVQQNYLQETEARQRIAATNVLIEQAGEGLRMSQERYRTGVATSIEITDAEITLANARISHLQAWFDYRVAHAKLLSSIGALHE